MNEVKMYDGEANIKRLWFSIYIDFCALYKLNYLLTYIETIAWKNYFFTIWATRAVSWPVFAHAWLRAWD